MIGGYESGVGVDEEGVVGIDGEAMSHEGEDGGKSEEPPCAAFAGDD
jgi:hypothetical protein